MPLTDVRHMAIEAEYRLQTARAEQGWRAREAAATRQRRMSRTAKARWAVGAMLVRLGARLQGAPCPESPFGLATG